MNRLTIWKTAFEVTDTQNILVPLGAQFLAVQAQHGAPCVWFLCDPSAPREMVRLAVYGTGHPIDPETARTYLGTFQLQGGAFVFHVFEEGRQPLAEAPS